jgi:succinate dehydrogenase / fumarate reductase membrane anchor subunit
MTTLTSTPTVRRVEVPKRLDTRMWQFMRWSGVLLIPLVWIHVLIKDVLVGVHRIDLNYVQQTWAVWGWRVYDAALLGFAFAHGMNGLRHIANDYLHNEKWQRIASWTLLIGWFVITAIGAMALVGGVRGVTK